MAVAAAEATETSTAGVGGGRTEVVEDGPMLPWHAAVLLPKSVLGGQTPSEAAGVAPEVERLHRMWGCTLIAEAGCLLQHPQVVVATAQNLFQRFFWRKSLADKRFDAFSVAMACMFLASKIEESIRRIRDVLYVFHHLYRKRRFCWTRDAAAGAASSGDEAVHARDSRRAPLELGGYRYDEWKRKLVDLERHVLKELGFGFHQVMQHPHKFLLYYIEFLKQVGMDSTEDQRKAMAQHAWAYLNDSMRLDLCVRHDAKQIACAAILLASRHDDVRIALPSPEWLHVLGADDAVVHEIRDAILSLYEDPLPGWLDPLAEANHLRSDRQQLFDQLEEASDATKRNEILRKLSGRSGVKPVPASAAASAPAVASTAVGVLPASSAAVTTIAAANATTVPATTAEPLSAAVAAAAALTAAHSRASPEAFGASNGTATAAANAPRGSTAAAVSSGAAMVSPSLSSPRPEDAASSAAGGDIERARSRDRGGERSRSRSPDRRRSRSPWDRDRGKREHRDHRRDRDHRDYRSRDGRRDHHRSRDYRDHHRDHRDHRGRDYRDRDRDRDRRDRDFRDRDRYGRRPSGGGGGGGGDRGGGGVGREPSRRRSPSPDGGSKKRARSPSPA